MIDIHCHLLPGLDDGPKSLEVALSMARLAVKGGIHTTICTPHWHPMAYPNHRETILEACNIFASELEKAKIPLDVRPGCELSLDTSLEEGISKGSLLTLNDGGRWILLELPSEILPPRLEDYFWYLQGCGYYIIIAHPERHPGLQSDPMRLYRWVKMGIFIQVTASSLLGRMGPKVTAFCRQLLTHRLIHFLGSDAHGIKWKRPILAPAVRVAEDILGQETALRLVTSHPKAVLKGKPLSLDGYQPIPLQTTKRHFSLFDLKGLLKKR